MIYNLKTFACKQFTIFFFLWGGEALIGDVIMHSGAKNRAQWTMVGAKSKKVLRTLFVLIGPSRALTTLRPLGNLFLFSFAILVIITRTLLIALRFQPDRLSLIPIQILSLV
jgi:hypothetical protein